MAKWSTLFPSGPGNIDALSTGIMVKTADGVTDTYANRTITGTANRIEVTDGDGVPGNPVIDIGADVTTVNNTQDLLNKTVSSTNAPTGALTLPNGTTGERPGTPDVGMVRWNSSLASSEIWDGAAWSPVGGGGSGDIPEWDVLHVVSSDTDIENALAPLKNDLNQTIGTGEKVLFRGQTAQEQNGIYEYTSFAIPGSFTGLTTVQSEDLSALTWTPATLTYRISGSSSYPGEDQSVSLSTGGPPPFVTEAYIDSTEQYLIARTTANNIYWILVKANSSGQDFENDDSAVDFDYEYRVALTNSASLTDSSLATSSSPTPAVVARSTDADNSSEFVVNKKVVAPSGFYKYSGIDTPTIDTDNLPFNSVVPFPWEYSSSVSPGSIANKNIVLTSTAAITIGSIDNSTVIILNAVNVTITGDISNSNIIGANTDTTSATSTMTVSGNTIRNSEIRWQISNSNETLRVFTFSGSAKTISASTLITNRYTASIAATWVNCYIGAMIVAVSTATTTIEGCQIFSGFIRCSSGTFGSGRSMVRAGLFIQESTGAVSVTNRSSFFIGQWQHNGTSGLTVTGEENSVSISAFSWSGSGTLSADNFGVITIGRLFTSAARSVTTPTSGCITVTQLNGSTLNGIPAGSRHFVSFNNSHTAGSSASSTQITQTAHGLAQFDWVYLNGANYTKARADSANTSSIVGMVSFVANANTFTLTTSGLVAGLSSLTAGADYFLSPTAAGTMTPTEPTTTGYVSAPVGIAVSTTSIQVAIKRSVVIGTSNVFTSITLANSATTTIQNISNFANGEGGVLTGTVLIDAATDYTFGFEISFTKDNAGTINHSVRYFAGDIPTLALFSVGVSGQNIQMTLGSHGTFVNARARFQLSASAVSPSLQIDVNNISEVVGTFTPTLAFGGNSVGIVYATQVGSYQKIGKTVHFRLYLVTTNKGSSTGTVSIRNLPFKSRTDDLGYSAVTIWPNGFSATNYAPVGYVAKNTTNIDLSFTPINANATLAASSSEVHWAASGSVMLTGSYITD
jgi:hypothetical protein